MNVVPVDGSHRLGRLRLGEVFDYYDYPVLFTVVDDLNHSYLALSVFSDQHGDAFLYVPQSAERHAATRSGLVSLRDAFAHPETGTALLVRPERLTDSVQTIPASEIQTGWLPIEGERLADGLTPSFTPQGLADLARSQGRPLVALELDQVGARNPSQMPLRRAGEILREYQELKDVLAMEVTGKSKSLESAADSEECLVMLQAASVVFIVAPYDPEGRIPSGGSPSNGLMHDVIAAAQAGPEDALIDRVAPFSKRTVSHVRDFLAALDDSGTGVTFHTSTYEGVVRSSRIALPRVREGLHALTQKSQLPSQTFTVRGYLVGIQHVKGLFWVTESSVPAGRKRARSYNGKIDRGLLESDKLEGISSGRTALYTFTISTEASISQMTNRTDRTRYRLADIEPVQDVPSPLGSERQTPSDSAAPEVR